MSEAEGMESPAWAGESELLTTTEPHEFHMVDVGTAYCICGWTTGVYAPLPDQGRAIIADKWRKHVRWYRDNPEVSPLQ